MRRLPAMFPLERLRRLARRRPLLVAGALSGTSADGVTVAVVRIRGAGPRARVEVLRFGTRPYPRAVRASLLRSPSLDAAEIARLSLEVADAFVRAVRSVAGRGTRLDLLGSHGQTVFHGGSRGTLQIGEADRIAEGLGVPIVSDFRQRDVAAGGEGAPLTQSAAFVRVGRRRGRA